MIRKIINQIIRCVITDLCVDGSLDLSSHDFISASKVSIKGLKLRPDMFDIHLAPLTLTWGYIGVIQLDGIFESLLTTNMKLTIDGLNLLFRLNDCIGVDYAQALHKIKLEIYSKLMSSTSIIKDLIQRAVNSTFESSLNPLKRSHAIWKGIEYVMKNLEILVNSVHIRIELPNDKSYGSMDCCDAIGITLPLLKVTTRTGSPLKTSHGHLNNTNVIIRDLQLFCDYDSTSYTKSHVEGSELLSPSDPGARRVVDPILTAFAERWQSDLHTAIIYPVDIEASLSIQLSNAKTTAASGALPSSSSSLSSSASVGGIILTSLTIQINKVRLTCDTTQLEVLCRMLHRIIHSGRRLEILRQLPACLLHMPIPIAISVGACSGTQSQSSRTAGRSATAQTQTPISSLDPYYSLLPRIAFDDDHVFPTSFQVRQLHSYGSVTLSTLQQYMLHAPSSSSATGPKKSWTRVAWHIAINAVLRDQRTVSVCTGGFRGARRWRRLAEIAWDRRLYACLHSRLLRVSARTGEAQHRSLINRARHGLNQAEIFSLHELEMKYPISTVLVFRKFSTAYAAARYACSASSTSVSWNDVVRLVTALIETQFGGRDVAGSAGKGGWNGSGVDSESVYSVATTSKDMSSHRVASTATRSSADIGERHEAEDFPDTASVMSEMASSVQGYNTSSGGKSGATATSTQGSPSTLPAAAGASAAIQANKKSSMFSMTSARSFLSSGNTGVGGSSVQSFASSTSLAKQMQRGLRDIKGVLKMDTMMLDDLDKYVLGVHEKKHLSITSYGPLFAHLAAMDDENKSDEDCGSVQSIGQVVNKRLEELPEESRLDFSARTVAEYVSRRHRRTLHWLPLWDVTISICELDITLRTPVFERSRHVFLKCSLTTCKLALDASSLAQSIPGAGIVGLGLVQLRFELGTGRLGLDHLKPSGDEGSCALKLSRAEDSNSPTVVVGPDSHIFWFFQSSTSMNLLSGCALLDFQKASLSTVPQPSAKNKAHDTPPVLLSQPVALDLQISVGSWNLSTPPQVSEKHADECKRAVSAFRELLRLNALWNTRLLLLEDNAIGRPVDSIVPYVMYEGSDSAIRATRAAVPTADRPALPDERFTSTVQKELVVEDLEMVDDEGEVVPQPVRRYPHISLVLCPVSKDLRRRQRLEILEASLPRGLTISLRTEKVTVDLCTKETFAKFLQGGAPLSTYRLWWAECLALNGSFSKDITIENISKLALRSKNLGSKEVQEVPKVTVSVEPFSLEATKSETPSPMLVVNSDSFRMSLPVDHSTILSYFAEYLSVDAYVK